jgi:NAD(P)-dependent dehydrogenase (short-subunit alcohol dehydrogenase family)
MLDRPTKLLVTGGTSGVGVALTAQLLAARHGVVVLGRRAVINISCEAAAILRGVAQGRPVVRIGVARVLPGIAAVAPWLGRRMMRGT